MRALFFVEPGRLEWREVPDLKVDGAEVAVVRPLAATPCDLDRALIGGRAPLPGPFPLGHECVAEVVDIGDAVRQVRVGDLVVVPWHISCGRCDRCQSGLTASCRNVPPRAMYGTPIGGDWGGLFSDQVRVPFADGMLVPLPPGLSPERVASASDNLTDAWLAVQGPLRLHPGAPVLVVGGVGSIGLFAVEMARAAGASSVDYVDKSPERLALAAALGATPIQRGQTLIQDYPVVVDASGNPKELVRALYAVAPGGYCTSVGIYFMDHPFPLLHLYEKDITFRMGRPSVGPHIRQVLGLVEAGLVHPERVTSRTAPWDDAIEVLLEMSLKPVLVRPPSRA